MKRAIYLVLFLLVLTSAHALVSNVTEFDDGGSAFNITANYTGYLTLPLNSTILQANITIKGLNTSNGSWIYGVNVTSTANSGWTGFYTGSHLVGVKITAKTLSSEYIILNNVTLYNGYDKATAIAVFSSDDTDLSKQLANCSISTGQKECNLNYALKNGSSVRVVSTNWCTIGNCYGYQAALKSRPNTDQEITYNQNIFYTVGGGWGSDGYNREIVSIDYVPMNITKIYPKNVNISVNGTNVFSHSNNLTGTNFSIDFSTALSSCNLYESVCPVAISADSWGKLEISDLFIQYNRTYYAILDILTPAQFSSLVYVGSSSTFYDVNISNSGTFNATNLSFVTVSNYGTPNYNDSISSSCFDSVVMNGSSILCNITFSSLIQDPEPDEKLKIRFTGSSAGDILFSEGYDVDINVQDLPAGGGGGGSSNLVTNWKITVPSNKVINKIGAFGYKTPPTTIQVYNNQSSDLAFYYKASGLDCDFEYNSLIVESYSFGNNKVVCDFPKFEDTGKIIVSVGQTSQNINVLLTSNDLGWFFIALSGKNSEFGVLFPIIFFGLIVGGLYFFIIKGGSR